MLNMIRDIILLVLMVLFMALVATIPNEALAEELLPDPDLNTGAVIHYSSGMGPNSHAFNLDVWDRAGTAPLWNIVEVCDAGCYADSGGPRGGWGNWFYRSDLKSVAFGDGQIVWDMDTSREHNDGCRLSAPGGLHSENNADWDWHHEFLTTKPDRSALQHDSLTFSVDLFIEHVEKVTTCPGWQNALMKIDIKVAIPGQPGIYILQPIFSTHDGVTTNPNAARPFFGYDPAGESVYIRPLHDDLVEGQWIRVGFDVIGLVDEALDHLAVETGQVTYVDEYELLDVAISFELWGGYRVRVWAENLSLWAEDYNMPAWHGLLTGRL